jgi:aspartate racemase
VQFISSPRNKPALDFLESVGADFRQSTNGHLDFHFPAAHAAKIAFNPERAAPRPQNPQPTLPGSPDPLSDGKFQISSAQVRWIALNAHNPALVLQTLASKPVPQAAPSQDYVPPRNPLEEQLCRAWEELLRLERVSVRDDFFERGGSSLMAVQLLARARKISGKNIPLSALFQAPTVEQLARLIADKPASSSAMVALQSTGRQPPLVLVHGAGGGILWGYANLATHLGSDQPVYAIEPQAAMGERSSVEELASRYLTELRTLQANGPYKLGGYCFGGYVAYEMARQLRTQGENVALVMLIDSAAPNGSYEKVTWWRPSFLPNFICNFFYWLQDFFNLTPTAQHDFVRRQFRVLKKKIIARFRRAGTKRIHLEKYVNTSDMPEHELSFWRLHLRAGADYVPQKCPGRVTLLRTRSQPLFCSFDPTYGWGDLATEGVDIKIIPGSHENIFVEPDVRSLAQQVKACLATAQGGGTEV